MRKNSQADRAQDNSDSYIRERLRLPKGGQGEITIRKEKKNISNLYSYMRERARLPRGDQRSEFCSSWWLAFLSLKKCWGETKWSLKVLGLCQFYIFWPSVLEQNCIQAIALTVEDNLTIFLETTLLLRALTSGQSTGPTTYFVSTALVDNHLSSIFVSYITCSKQSSNFIICAIVI